MKDTNEHESKVPKSKAPAEKGVDGKSKVKKTTSKPPDTDELKPSSVVRRETGETRVEKVEKQKNPPPVERPVAVVQDEPDYEVGHTNCYFTTGSCAYCLGRLRGVLG
jgi:hypothetical protein